MVVNEGYLVNVGYFGYRTIIQVGKQVTRSTRQWSVLKEVQCLLTERRIPAADTAIVC